VFLHRLSTANWNGFLCPGPHSEIGNAIQGRLKSFRDTGDSGQPVERICLECGSPIFSDAAVIPALTFLKGWQPHPPVTDAVRSAEAKEGFDERQPSVALCGRAESAAAAAGVRWKWLTGAS
jgi:hypothetical protein